MLLDSLSKFNTVLEKFNKVFERPTWNEEFTNNLLNDFSFFSNKVENTNIQYGDTIRFLNGELIRVGKMKSLLDVSNYKDVLLSLFNTYNTFQLTEETIKSIHRLLMSEEYSWEVVFKPHLVGEYRNIPTEGNRQPLYPNKQYVPHYIQKALAEKP